MIEAIYAAKDKARAARAAATVLASLAEDVRDDYDDIEQSLRRAGVAYLDGDREAVEHELESVRILTEGMAVVPITEFSTADHLAGRALVTLRNT